MWILTICTERSPATVLRRTTLSADGACKRSVAKNLSRRVAVRIPGLHLPRRVRFLFNALSGKAAAYLRGQTGFTLIEIVIAVGILGFIGVGFLTALNTSSRATRQIDEQVVASNLAVAHIEAIKGSPYAATYPNAGDDITIPFQYSVATNIQYSNDGTTWVDSYTDETLEKITIAVSREGRPVFAQCTYRCKR